MLNERLLVMLDAGATNKSAVSSTTSLFGAC